MVSGVFGAKTPDSTHSNLMVSGKHFYVLRNLNMREVAGLENTA